MQEISTRYNPKEVENKWSQFWEEGKLFEVHTLSPKKPYCIVIPPPNITGSLHMGHALDGTLQDIIIRFKRMQGFEALWIPGCDHGGIATENVIEKELAKQNINKRDLGRDKLISKIEDWKDKHEKRIILQLKKLGCSCDWSRFAFTMDEQRSKAVKEAFFQLFEDGLIYRGNYIVNWCPRCQTALSNVEVEHEDTEGKLFHINYPLKDGKGQITVATTRPETMFGDMAVAVNPQDKRYKRFVNKTLILPLAEREIPVISDERVSISFGTGAVKVTPAHDPADFEIGKTHGLTSLVIMDKEGKMKQVPKRYEGLERFKCREEVINDLRKEGYLVKIVSHAHAVGHCYRCKTVIEPYLSTQWFADVQKLKGPAVKAVKSGTIKFIPERWGKIYLNWMDEVKDWCISRQIWWGHTIPVSYCENCDEIMLNRDNTDGKSCKKCGSEKITKETDVLDTWFSSSLWPVSTLGWPQDTADLKHFYPTSTLVTGYEIIYLWVARMIMMGLKLKGDVPFRTVYIHPIIRDKKGRKMSKSEGNVVDPLELIEDFGTDALRMALAQLNTGAGQDIVFSLDRFEGMKNFSNKIWNASRFAIGNLGDGFKPVEDIYELPLELDEKFILRRAEEVNKKVTELLENFQFNESAELLFKFFWHEFCDWYIELIKYKFKKKNGSSESNPVLSETAEISRQALFYVLGKVLRLLHPFMPFITEEIWQHLSQYNGNSKSITVAEWPISKIDKIEDKVVEEATWKYEVIQASRNLRAQCNISFHEKLNFIVIPSCEKEGKILLKEKGSIMSVVNAEDIQIKKEISAKERFSSQVTSSGTCVYLLLKDIDLERENIRIKEELTELDDGLIRIEKKLANRDFMSKAQPSAIEKCKSEKEELLKKREKLQQILKTVGRK